jgi:hypothetical protein
MGTHIDCIIPKEKEYSVEEIKQKLKSAYDRLKSEFLHLEEYGTFTKKVNENWWISYIPSENGNPEYITGERDSFNIDIYKKVIHIGCIESFSSLYLNENNVSAELFKIITELSKEFRTSDKILIGAGGFGETDLIMDMAFNESADFEQLCGKMTELNGIPASDLTELKDRSWYLKK